MQTKEFLKRQIKNIDATIDKLGSTDPRKVLELQKMAGEKEKQLKRLEYLEAMEDTRLNNTRHLLNDIMSLMDGEEYGDVKAEVEDVYQVVLAKWQEIDDETLRRFT